MNAFAILTNRKRAIIALVHSVFFGMLATYQLAISQRPVPLLAADHRIRVGSVIMASIYTLVTAILLWLIGLSRCARERMYFLFCATSAAVGWARVVFGDPTLHFASLVRVSMLGFAVVTGLLILREHGDAHPQFAE